MRSPAFRTLPVLQIPPHSAGTIATATGRPRAPLRAGNPPPRGSGGGAATGENGGRVGSQIEHTGLSGAEVSDRVARGLVNDVPKAPTRTYGQIVRTNVITRFNILLGSLLAVILVVGPLQDALFGIVLVSNALVGIIQEVRAKRTLERLELVNAPRASVLRDNQQREIQVGEVVLDDLLEVGPGDQVVVDGKVLDSLGLEVDESMLTGEAEPVGKAPGEEILSGSFVVAGGGAYRATRIGGDAQAARLAERARRFTLARSELRAGIDRIITMVTWVLIPTAALLFATQLAAQHQDLRGGLRGAVAGSVAMVPEGLVLLTSVTFAVSVVRLGRRQVLVQELLRRTEAIAVEGRRVVLLASAAEPAADGELFDGLEPAAFVVLGDRVRADAAPTIAYFLDQGVSTKVLSGDHPRTVAAVARQVGIPGTDEPIDARSMPSDPAALADLLEHRSVF